MRLFLDTSMILAASGSSRGASSEVFRLASVQRWTLIATPYVIEEVERNVFDLAPGADAEWAKLRPTLLVLDDVLTTDRVVVFPVSKDRPVLFSALAWADVLLTRDTGDFTRLLGRAFYGLHVLTPGGFLQRERAAGRLKARPCEACTKPDKASAAGHVLPRFGTGAVAPQLVAGLPGKKKRLTIEPRKAIEILEEQIKRVLGFKWAGRGGTAGLGIEADHEDAVGVPFLCFRFACLLPGVEARGKIGFGYQVAW